MPFSITPAKQHPAASAPIAIAPIGATNPAPGVMHTSPATRPDATPSIVALPCSLSSMSAHTTAPAAAATCVLTNAYVAVPSAFSAEPALNPNHPNHRMPAPSTVIVRLCGG